METADAAARFLAPATSRSSEPSGGGVAVDPLSHAARLEAAERQLAVFAREINQLYRAERDRRAELARVADELGSSQLASVRTLVAAVEAWDPTTHAHLERTQQTADALIGVVEPALAADRRLSYGFLLHDVGKLGIPAAILDKPGPLDAREWRVMHTHPLLGLRIVAGMPFLGPAVDVIGCHHERWDGRGYPHGLRGAEIPLAARVFAVCDAFDAMTSDRSYRRALPVERVLDELGAGAGTQFDPTVVTAFMSELEAILALHAGPRHGEQAHAGSSAGR
jgi:HD-GYP domain-containing protein (c-di-GMP phosphodiesterase class II)